MPPDNSYDRDHYQAYYTDKLWNLLPAIYRATDTESDNTAGPLRELVARIGTQAAVLRRSIDRLWQDQSIETCDDWVIAYIADLLATKLVANLDSRGQRIDVGKTIYYRRRKGTLPLLEELAANITGWDVKVVEFFRRLGRNRHNLDPAIGLPSATDDPAGNLTLQQDQGLAGKLTETPMGGYADVRNVFGAGLTNTAFDEFFHTADVRKGVGKNGWYNIPKLGVFAWRLISFGLGPTTPVALIACPGQYVFDPTGRQISLFAKSWRDADALGVDWVSPELWELPGPISPPLLKNDLADLYGQSLTVLSSTDVDDVIDPANLVIYPDLGRFTLTAAEPALFVTYHYGFSSTIGAGPYDRRTLSSIGVPPSAPGAPSVTATGGQANTGANSLVAGLTSVAANGAGAVVIDDSLTYSAVINVPVNGSITLVAANMQRPVIRLPASAAGSMQWEFTGASETSNLYVEGLLISGGDIVLNGTFGTVTLRCCTLDPGSAGRASGTFAVSADNRPLIPTRLIIAASIRCLIIDRCVAGPIFTVVPAVGTAEVEQMNVTDSILQSQGFAPAAAINVGRLSLPPVGTENVLDFNSGEANLCRVTVMGHGHVHQLKASDCILGDVFKVDNAQDGCVRFSAWSTGSILPRQYESLQVAAGSQLFVSRDFGQPGFAQLLDGNPQQLLTGTPNGSEMGGFSGQQNSVKENGLLIKYAEYMPLGLVPVIIHVT